MHRFRHETSEFRDEVSMSFDSEQKLAIKMMVANMCVLLVAYYSTTSKSTGTMYDLHLYSKSYIFPWNRCARCAVGYAVFITEDSI